MIFHDQLQLPERFGHFFGGFHQLIQKSRFVRSHLYMNSCVLKIFLVVGRTTGAYPIMPLLGSGFFFGYRQLLLTMKKLLHGLGTCSNLSNQHGWHMSGQFIGVHLREENGESHGSHHPPEKNPIT